MVIKAKWVHEIGRWCEKKVSGEPSLEVLLIEWMRGNQLRRLGEIKQAQEEKI